ncbi:histone H1-like [Elgaria multicarinata webbii]|uniref:histone H1-like n=1 Tax=Elgaria multicarinata webbii TaxID=159646 RepID=UPI002FCD0F3D
MVHEKRQGAPVSAEASTSDTSEPTKRGKNRVSSSLSQLIMQAFETCNPSRKGLSLAALKKFLTEAGYNVSKNNSRLKRELNNLVSNGLLIRITGSGASGSFKFSGAQARKKTGKPKKEKQKTAAAKKAAGNKEPKKKSRKKQPAVNKPKGLKSRTSAAPGRKRQLNKHPTGKGSY